jgi:hypothetical protein
MGNKLSARRRRAYDRLVRALDGLNTPLSLFIGVMPTGIGYCDTSKEEHGDYQVVAFLPFRSLELEVRRPRSPLLAAIREDAARIQARRGEDYIVSGCGQTVRLGGERG